MLPSLNVLYVESEDQINDNLVEALEFMSMKVTIEINIEQAYIQYLNNKPDLIISDIDKKNLNGLALVEKIRADDKEMQIIIATTCTKVECLVRATELNLVKYLLKPVSLIALKEALLICINNISLREKNYNKYFNKEDYYNLKKQILIVNSLEVKLDNHERDFLELLLINNYKVVSYIEIETSVWKNKMSSAAIRSLVRNLRKKLPLKVIENVSKIGYKISID